MTTTIIIQYHLMKKHCKHASAEPKLRSCHRWILYRIYHSIKRLRKARILMMRPYDLCLAAVERRGYRHQMLQRIGKKTKIIQRTLFRVSRLLVQLSWTLLSIRS